MLRLYKPLINHEIFKLHSILEHLVCSVWCEACDDDCKTKLNEVFKYIYDSYEWLKKGVDEIYEICKTLTTEEKKSIREAFTTNNQIEKLCNGELTPIYLCDLPTVVKDNMKPLLVKFYEELLDRSKVTGTKQDYYQKLINHNDLQDCPCCGLSYFESSESRCREAYDHYLPKAQYPFLSVNFENLVPLCYKCNSDRKGTKNPIEDNRKAFYPFKNTADHNIHISFEIIDKDKPKELATLKRSDLKVIIYGDTDKINTWDWLFDIKERYNDSTRGFTKYFLGQIIRQHKEFQKANDRQSYTETLDKLIADYKYEKYTDKKFLKIAYMEELKNCTHLIDLYNRR